MSEQHTFILQPGRWVGEGTVSFSASPEKMFFVTRWEVSTQDEQGVHCQQEVKMEGNGETVVNRFFLANLTTNAFDIALENEIMGQVGGSGIIDESTIAWELRGENGVIGYEVYELHKDGEYSFHAEYSSPDQFRTIIDGRIRQQDL